MVFHNENVTKKTAVHFNSKTLVLDVLIIPEVIEIHSNRTYKALFAAL